MNSVLASVGLLWRCWIRGYLLKSLTNWSCSSLLIEILDTVLISRFQDMDELLSAIRETQVLHTNTQVTNTPPEQDYLTWNWDLISLILEVCNLNEKGKKLLAIFCLFVMFYCKWFLYLWFITLRSVNYCGKVFSLLAVIGLDNEWFAKWKLCFTDHGVKSYDVLFIYFSRNLKDLGEILQQF